MGTTPAKRLLALSVTSARESLYLSSGYFVPDHALVGLLGDAVGQGFDVRVLSASRDQTDVPVSYWAGRSRYRALLENGVRIFEYVPARLHAKSFVVDSAWCGISALNLDNRSLALHDGSSLLVCDENVGGAVMAVFREDLAREVQLPDLDRRRGVSG